ncbi:sugar phosphate isomerase/epimerase [Actinoplanes sp. NPDC049118]|uniref:sugar phosphate isomerase/epimerase family protein n=1 Tax=Actinoplanes sp. NPDC049118 TaxID=3155769 RepID=UPI0034031E04
MDRNPGGAPPGPAARSRLTRRGILAASAAAAVALGAAGMNIMRSDAPAGTGREPLIPARNRGLMLYSVRDRITAAPDDSGVPYGFERVLARVAELGYAEVEFAGYDQSTEILGRQITPAEIRRILDDNGLVANGAHTRIDPDTFERQMDIAQTLGMANIGTGADPSGSPYPADWDVAADLWNGLGRRAHARGLRLYTHNHAAAYSFLLDEGPPDAAGRPTRSSGTRRLEYFFGRADPRYVFFELDIYWAYVARFRYRRYVDRSGAERTGLFDPILNVAANSRRFPLFHAKDGDRDSTRADGHVMTPLGEGDIDFQRFFATIGDPDFRHPNWEQDTAPGGAANPAQSLEFAARSYRNMSELTVHRR